MQNNKNQNKIGFQLFPWQQLSKVILKSTEKLSSNLIQGLNEQTSYYNKHCLWLTK